MLAEALLQIIGHSQIALTFCGQALNKINVVQVKPLLRSSFGGRPASRERVSDPAKRKREAGRMGDSNPPENNNARDPRLFDINFPSVAVNNVIDVHNRFTLSLTLSWPRFIDIRIRSFGTVASIFQAVGN